MTQAGLPDSIKVPRMVNRPSWSSRVSLVEKHQVRAERVKCSRTAACAHTMNELELMWRHIQLTILCRFISMTDSNTRMHCFHCGLINIHITGALSYPFWLIYVCVCVCVCVKPVPAATSHGGLFCEGPRHTGPRALPHLLSIQASVESSVHPVLHVPHSRSDSLYWNQNQQAGSESKLTVQWTASDQICSAA